MRTSSILWFALVACFRMTAAPAATELQGLVDRSVSGTLAEFRQCKRAGHGHAETCQLRSNQLAVTVIELSDTNRLQASYRGTVPIYPASVVKLFYLAATHAWLEEGKIRDSDELRRALRDMIVESYNEATHYVVDVLTGTTGGPELPEPTMTQWANQRNAVNRYFRGLGYEGINVNQKPWGEGPYGRERVFVGKQYENRNQLTTDATARLLADIARQQFVSAARCREMLELLRRNPKNAGDNQATDYIGAAIPEGARLWSKAGWTSTTRHDAAFVELPGGRLIVLVIFTTGHSEERQIIPALARRILGAHE